MVRHHNSFGCLGLIDRISQESHTALMLLVELAKSQRLSVEKNPMEICYSILSGKGSFTLEESSKLLLPVAITWTPGIWSVISFRRKPMSSMR